MSDFLRSWGPLIGTALVALSGGAVAGRETAPTAPNVVLEALADARAEREEAQEQAKQAWQERAKMREELAACRLECRQ